MKQQEGSRGWCLNLSHLQPSDCCLSTGFIVPVVLHFSVLSIQEPFSPLKSTKAALSSSCSTLGTALRTILTHPASRCPVDPGWWVFMSSVCVSCSPGWKTASKWGARSRSLWNLQILDPLIFGKAEEQRSSCPGLCAMSEACSCVLAARVGMSPPYRFYKGKI